MSNEPIASERTTREALSTAQASSKEFPLQPPADLSADAKVVLAAIGRMEAAIRNEHLALGRLRHALTEASAAVAKAKRDLQLHPAIGQAGLMVALLDELDHRIDAMIEMVVSGLAPVEQPRPENELLPVAGVPSPEAQAPDGEGEKSVGALCKPAAGVNAGDQVPTVSAVVSQLGRTPEVEASDQRAAAESASEGVPSVAMLQAMVKALSGPATGSPLVAEKQPHQEPAELTPVIPAADEADDPPPIARDEVSSQTTTSPHESFALQEHELLANLSRMETFPIPEPEFGTTVIFPPKNEAIGSQPPSPPEPLSSTEQEFDPAAFLFGPEPEPDPVAFLLESAAPPSPARPPESLRTLASDAPEQAPDGSPRPGKPTQAQASSAQSDPLAPLKCLSAVEILALFS